MTPDLSEDETRALADLLKRAIDDDRYPLSPRIQRLRAILAKLDPSTGCICGVLSMTRARFSTWCNADATLDRPCGSCASCSKQDFVPKLLVTDSCAPMRARSDACD